MLVAGRLERSPERLLDIVRIRAAPPEQLAAQSMQLSIPPPLVVRLRLHQCLVNHCQTVLVLLRPATQARQQPKVVWQAQPRAPGLELLDCPAQARNRVRVRRLPCLCAPEEDVRPAP